MHKPTRRAQRGAETDSKVMTVCTEFWPVHKQLRAINDERPRRSDRAAAKVNEDWWAAVKRLIDLPASRPPAVHAKAEVALAALMHLETASFEEADFERIASDDLRLVAATLRDVTAEGV